MQPAKYTKALSAGLLEDGSEAFGELGITIHEQVLLTEQESVGGVREVVCHLPAGLFVSASSGLWPIGGVPLYCRFADTSSKPTLNNRWRHCQKYPRLISNLPGCAPCAAARWLSSKGSPLSEFSRSFQSRGNTLTLLDRTIVVQLPALPLMRLLPVCPVNKNERTVLVKRLTHRPRNPRSCIRECAIGLFRPFHRLQDPTPWQRKPIQAP